MNFKAFPYIFVLSFFCFSNPDLSAQHAIGLRYDNLFGQELQWRNFDFMYEKIIKDKRWLRCRLGAVNLVHQINTSTGIQRTNVYAAAALGVGWRLPLNSKKNLVFVHGFEPSVALGMSNTINMSPLVYTQIGVGYVLGVQWEVLESLVLGIETVPQVSTQLNISNLGANIYTNGRFNLNAIALTVMYRFNRA